MYVCCTTSVTFMDFTRFITWCSLMHSDIKYWFHNANIFSVLRCAFFVVTDIDECVCVKFMDHWVKVCRHITCMYVSLCANTESWPYRPHYLLIALWVCICVWVNVGFITLYVNIHAQAHTLPHIPAYVALQHMEYLDAGAVLEAAQVSHGTECIMFHLNHI